MIFDKPSTRTRSALEDAAWALGCSRSSCDPTSSSLATGEPWRTPRASFALPVGAHDPDLCPRPVEELAATPGIPIINALTDEHHPCQALADVDDAEEALAASRAGGSPSSETEQRAHSLNPGRRVPGFGPRSPRPEGYRPDPVIVAAARVRPRPRVARSCCSPSRPCVRGVDGRVHGRLGVHGQGSRAEERRKVSPGTRWTRP